jgi:trimethylamine:corrinoid methyltransferase-like protein
MLQRGLLKDSDVERLGEAVLKTLEKVGVLCQNREILEALRKSGAKVDLGRDSVTFPRKMVESSLEQIRKEAKPQAKEVAPRFGSPGLAGVGTQVAQFFLDYGTNERRSGNRKDLIEMTKLGEALHGQSGVGHSLLLTDVPPLMEPLEAAMVLAEYATKPHPAFAWNVRQADYLIEMGEILGIKHWFTWGANCFAHPLRFDKDVADKFARRVKLGETAGFAAMPVAGVTTPVSVAGFIVVTGAELVATWLAGRALNPTVALGGGIWGATMDMKTGEVSYNTCDSMLFAFACSEFMRRWTGKEIPVGGGEYCDAKIPGYYAALEKAYKAMTIAALSGRHPSIGQGMLDKGKTICPVQLLLEREMGVGVQIFGRPIEVTPETLALDEILAVGFGLTKNHLDSDHTLRHYRRSLWCPEVMDRSPWEGHQREEAVLKRLQAKVKDLISGYQKPKRDPDKLAKMREVVKRAKKELGA